MQEGRICQVGRPSEFFHRPATVFVAGFIGSTPMNLLPGRYHDGRVQFGAGAELPAPDGVTAHDGADVVYGVRPEYVDVAAGGDGATAGTVSIIENLGTHQLVSVDVEGMIVRAAVLDGEEPQIGAQVHLRPQRHRSLLYRGSDGVLLDATPNAVGRR
jgi:multiple sugar transport system ATP-binding protein